MTDLKDKAVRIKGTKNYFIDRDGNIYSNLVVCRQGVKVSSKLRKLKGCVHKSGHISVRFWRSKRSRYVHQLVLETFVSSRPKGKNACHRNDVKSDNRLENLYWGTQSENMKDALRNGRMVNTILARTGVSPANKLNSETIERILKYRKQKVKIVEIARYLGISFVTVQKYCAKNGLNEVGLSRWYAGEVISNE